MQLCLFCKVRFNFNSLQWLQSLQWQLELKSKELQTAQEQLKLSEERQLAEMANMRKILQVWVCKLKSLNLS